jgi:hypothetical protein
LTLSAFFQRDGLTQLDPTGLPLGGWIPLELPSGTMQGHPLNLQHLGVELGTVALLNLNWYLHLVFVRFVMFCGTEELVLVVAH